MREGGRGKSIFPREGKQSFIREIFNEENFPNEER